MWIKDTIKKTKLVWGYLDNEDIDNLAQAIRDEIAKRPEKKKFWKNMSKGLRAEHESFNKHLAEFRQNLLEWKKEMRWKRHY